jgi:hypothetical protein
VGGQEHGDTQQQQQRQQQQGYSFEVVCRFDREVAGDDIRRNASTTPSAGGENAATSTRPHPRSGAGAGADAGVDAGATPTGQVAQQLSETSWNKYWSLGAAVDFNPTPGTDQFDAQMELERRVRCSTCTMDSATSPVAGSAILMATTAWCLIIDLPFDGVNQH